MMYFSDLNFYNEIFGSKDAFVILKNFIGCI